MIPFPSSPHLVCFGIDVAALYAKYKALTGEPLAASNLVLAHVQSVQQETVDLLDTAEAARRLGISREQVSVLCRQGQIKHSRVGKLIKIRPADIDAYLTPATTSRHW